MSSKRRGFTFAEVLAAMLFMAIVIPAVMYGMMLANRVNARAIKKRHAVQLADSILNEQIITGDWVDGTHSGDFGDDAPDFRWEVATADWTEAPMQLVTVTVSYTVQEQPFSESISTLAIEETEEPVE